MDISQKILTYIAIVWSFCVLLSCVVQNVSECVHSPVPPLQFRFPSLTTNFLTSTTLFPQNPIFQPSLSLCPKNSLRISLEAHRGKHLRLEPLPPTYSSFPPWTLAPPVIRLDLAALPRSPNSTYLKHIKAIIVSEFSSVQLKEKQLHGPLQTVHLAMKKYFHLD